MAFRVTISARAESNLDEIIEYLDREWPKKVKDDFLLLLKEKIHFISENPYLYPVSGKRKGVRRCVLGQQNILYYRIQKIEIEIITIQDGRKNPKKLRL